MRELDGWDGMEVFPVGSVRGWLLGKGRNVQRYTESKKIHVVGLVANEMCNLLISFFR